MSRDKSIGPDRNAIRRAQYASDAGASGAARDDARQKYRENTGQGSGPRTPRLAGGLFTQGQQREVIAGEMDHPEQAETFTIPEAAAALGRSVPTIRRWIESDKIPEPILEDVQHHYKVYSVGELQVIARVIADHEREFQYLATEHNQIVERLHQAVHGYRANNI